MQQHKEENQDERPPLFRRWSSWYILVLSALVVQVIIYYLITLHFS